ncbi:hypothetical protein E3983_10195 [Legionella israelensis]|uniref:ApeA N-terminal domain-containing protein n=1 Tax=Legionella israelensis TaxID=454 RepID=A0AAX1EIQ8_9GAMM|nr:HEPN domain-containing protein [Legionella israelensis]QBR84702.1 hypothetical protein E3983_10195 [Legionella israelensis]
MRVEKMIERRGEFWLPGAKKNKRFGILIIQDGGEISLEMNQLFKGTSYRDKIDRIIGYFEDGTPVVLEDGFYLKYPIFETFISDTKVFFHKAYFGLNLTGKKDINFSEIQFSFENISSWHHSDYLALDIKKRLPNPLPLFTKFKRSYVFEFKSGIRLEIKPNTNFHFDHQSFEMRGNLLFKLSSEEKCSLEQYLKHIKVITSFVNFCSQRPKNLINVRGRAVNDGDNISNEISIYYQSIFFYHDFNKKQREFLLNFEDLLDSDILLDNWDNLLKKTHPSIQLYLTSIFGDYKFLEKRYLSLVQALEIFHRGLTDDFSPSNKGASFCDRLKELFKPIEAYIGSSKKRKSFLGYIVVTRNELTHTGRAGKVNRDKKYSLFDLIIILESIMTILILNHIGVSESRMQATLQRNDIIIPLL